MFGLFGRRKGGSDPLDKRVKDKKCRKISYVDCDMEELKSGMEQSCGYIMKLTPVNYYAVKNEYVLALIYTEEDYSENFVRFKRVSYEKITDETKIYALDKITLSKALAKVGIIIKAD